MRTRRGDSPGNPLPLRGTSQQVGWTDLVPAPVEANVGRNYIEVRDKQLRALNSALDTLSAESVQLVSLRHYGRAKGKYENFALLDEGGVYDGATPDPYTVPRNGERYFTLPDELFRRGWIHVLDDSELILLMMIALRSGLDGMVKFTSQERVLHFGFGRDSYEAHRTLSAFGLIQAHSINRHEDGRVIDYNPKHQRRDLHLHQFRLIDAGFDAEPLTQVQHVLQRKLNHSGK
ncbi:hypothetical protein JYK22_02450, partial [Nonomuraea sp. RK-328]|nr:hypothetical protein [Nonomuraea sp. RK-328]